MFRLRSWQTQIGRSCKFSFQRAKTINRPPRPPPWHRKKKEEGSPARYLPPSELQTAVSAIGFSGNEEVDQFFGLFCVVGRKSLEERKTESERYNLELRSGAANHAAEMHLATSFLLWYDSPQSVSLSRAQGGEGVKEGGRWIDSVKRPSLKVSPSDPTDPSQLLSSQYYTQSNDSILEILGSGMREPRRPTNE